MFKMKKRKQIKHHFYDYLREKYWEGNEYILKIAEVNIWDKLGTILGDSSYWGIERYLWDDLRRSNEEKKAN